MNNTIQKKFSKVYQDAFLKYSYSTDASVYRYMPELVVFVDSKSEIIDLIDYALTQDKTICFRAAGTSLSGQTQTDGILCDISRSFKNIEIINNADSVIVEPSVILSKINRVLIKHSKKIGPDPASINSCMIGGVIANNSSGLSSGIDKNPYSTIENMEIILSDKSIISTFETSEYYNQFSEFGQNILDNLLKIRNKILKNDSLKNKIINKYKVKNTVGYSLNAFIEFDNSLDILKHLIIGSEGTLAFVSKVQMKTFDIKTYKQTAIIFIKDYYLLLNHIQSLKNFNPSALEFMDYYSLLSVKNLDLIGKNIASLDENSAAILIEIESDNLIELNELANTIDNYINNNFKEKLIDKTAFMSDKYDQEKVWKIRKGLLSSIGANRPKGTSFLVEDIAFSLDKLAPAISDLKQLLSKYNYQNTAIYGHGLDGNVHFMISENFEKDERIELYDRFMNELAELVCKKYDGSLKAEHGTGRNMAPFVEKEWGSECYDIMKEIKQLFDPYNVFNKGVLINSEPKIHLKNLKKIEITNDEADKCIECGFCEHVCPTRDVSVSPRIRISQSRYIKSVENNNISIDKKLIDKFNYNYSNTCVTDSLCSMVCPVGIDTGKLVKIYREKQNNILQKNIAKFISSNSNMSEKIMSKSIDLTQHILNNNKISKSNVARKFIPQTNFSSKIEVNDEINPDLYYFPTCSERLMGNIQNTENQAEKFLEICHKIGIKVQIIQSTGLCCGMSMDSKGLKDASLIMQKNIYETLNIMNDKDIVISSSSCFSFLNTNQDFKKFKFLDFEEFCLKYLSKEDILYKEDLIVYHASCSSQKSNNDTKLLELLSQNSKNIEKIEKYCCGMGGDRALLYPEIICANKKSNLLNNIQLAQINANKNVQFITNNYTCCVGLNMQNEFKWITVLDYYYEKLIKNEKEH